MLLLRGFWNRHRRKVLFAFGALGGGYVIYKLYDAHRTRAAVLERHFEGAQEVDELFKSQLQTLFDNIQKISDTTTLPCAVHYLRYRIAADLDHSFLTEKLQQAKGQQYPLTPKEKMELWERLKVLSFTRLTTSVWSMTMLCLYVKVLGNILGRHLYVDISHGSGGSQALTEAESFGRHGHLDFLATADYLPVHGINALIVNMQSASAEVLKDKQLKDTISMENLHEMVMQIMQLFMSFESQNFWISYIVPENASTYRQMMSRSFSGTGDSSVPMAVDRLEQLVSETWVVLSSSEFRSIAELSLSKLVGAVVNEIYTEFSRGRDLASEGIPLATLLSRVAQFSHPLLEEPSSNRFIHIIHTLPEAQLFYTLLYSNTPPIS